MTQEDTTMTTRKALNVQADTISANVLTLEGSPKARVTLAETGAPVAGLEINFRSGSAKIEACASFTNTEGIAECSQGTKLSVAYILDIILAGYDAVFDGNAEFQPAKGHGSVTPVP
ncbi:MAG: hypothetical protein WCF33_05600 [Pseudonocardiaceae bacterium]